MESHKVNSIISGRSPPLYCTLTYINHLVGTPKQKQTNYLLHIIFGLRVPDDGTVTFSREIKLKMGFGVVRCYYDKIYLQLIDVWAASDYNGP